jgi:hypothetical protein
LHGRWRARPFSCSRHVARDDRDAAALGVAFAIAAIGSPDEPDASHIFELAATSVFASLFILSAWLFRRAAKV